MDYRERVSLLVIDVRKLISSHKKLCSKDTCEISLDGETTDTGLFVSPDPIRAWSSCGGTWVIDRTI